MYNKVNKPLDLSWRSIQLRSGLTGSLSWAMVGENTIRFSGQFYDVPVGQQNYHVGNLPPEIANRIKFDVEPVVALTPQTHRNQASWMTIMPDGRIVVGDVAYSSFIMVDFSVSLK